MNVETSLILPEDGKRLWRPCSNLSDPHPVQQRDLFGTLRHLIPGQNELLISLLFRTMTIKNYLYYGDNLEVLRKSIKDETVDLCYIDPPFNSQRNYNQIYNNIGTEDVAQAQAFTDTWVWDSIAISGYEEIIDNPEGRFTPQTVELIKGLRKVLGEGSLLAYIVSLTLRVAEIQRVLKKDGSFYLHCDPTASHYLKLVLDGIFCAKGGDFKNEIVWKRTTAHSDTKQGLKRYGKIHDVLLFYSKSRKPKFNTQYVPYEESYIESHYRNIEPGTNRRYRTGDLTGNKPGGDTEFLWRVKRVSTKGSRWEADLDNEWESPKPGFDYKAVPPYNGRYWAYSKDNLVEYANQDRLIHTESGMPEYKRYLDEMPGMPLQDIWTDINPLNSQANERLDYPTQKPLTLLERIISSSTSEGDVVLDAYCGCGTTIDAAQKLKRNWIGIDITYQSIAVVVKRLEDTYGKAFVATIVLGGIPKDMKSVHALANKKDDRLRKEFEKWAVLTYTTNRAVINEKKGADGGIDGVAYFRVGKKDNAKIIFQAKSGGVSRKDIATLRGDMVRTEAALGILITLEPPSKPMLNEAKAAGQYKHEDMGKSYDRITIVTVQEIIEDHKRLEIPMSLEVLKAAQKEILETQLNLL
jgi:DNA modification methylase